MKSNIVSDILRYLGEHNEKPINIEQMGFLSSKMIIKKLVYSVNCDILNIEDETSNTYLSINLNQLYKVENISNDICLYLDNDIKIKLF